MHVLEAGFEAAGRPLRAAAARLPGTRLLLAQGDAARWRRPATTSSRRTSAATAAPPAGTPTTTATSRRSGMLNLVRDMLGAGRGARPRYVAAVIGHDFGSPVAAWCALLRPDVFRSVALMSAPFAGPPRCPSAPRVAAPAVAGEPTSMRRWPRSTRRASTTSGTTRRARPTPTCGAARRACTPSCAPTTTTRAPTGRATSRFRLASWTRRGAGEAADLLHHGPRPGHGGDGGAGDAVAAEIAACRWLPDDELARLRRGVRAHRLPGRAAMVPLRTDGASTRELAGLRRAHDRRAVDASSPARSDWGMYQRPGALERMQRPAPARAWRACIWSRAPGTGCSRSSPEEVTRLLLEFLRRARKPAI